MSLHSKIISLFIFSVTVFSIPSLGGIETASLSSPKNSHTIPLLDLDQSEIVIIKSLVDPKTISVLMNKNYTLEDPITSSLLSTGNNDIYLVTAGSEKYVLRLSGLDKYLTMSESEFLFELEWLEYLHENQVPVSHPIRRTDNRLCGLIPTPEGPRYATLFSYAEGTTNLSVEQAFILGKSLAQLHEISNNFETTLPRTQLDLDKLIHRPIQQIKDFFGSDNDKIAFLDDLANELTKKISNVEITQSSYGIIAGDVHGSNQHFTADNKLTMFDFEFCAYGHRVYDIATFRWAKGANNEERWQSFLQGYQTVRVLTNSEHESIETFVKARHLWWLGYLLELFDYKLRLDDGFWEQQLARLVPIETD